ncbi:universal stress protein [Nitrosomonas ureae]|uniref:Nucleotide-binding universal stress UspA family protein n=1 Tax=Nitrosomonas ureae TaxID=44577 RepID=A0A0S3AFX0_9PROT|nr:universal stress protein [Nitrosomonas ureae]ALQ49915.1 hypothetical protein ATY38_00835 [Nitrosomonas ureae]PTQ84804.1 nucleotide-binding universal stress UspA family protein [Nitrosomonas ureae]PXX13636.1 nucleotide-binding universal stress UspA family protein [Nitrosomonas ureae]SDT94444.1 Nucleotide-binding universal stress protein, UspA family [Nitrosomonas ureae]SEP74868.1 Nucleotide-binding universal stress protein, UspA family [Nitrosomonas ureae]
MYKKVYIAIDESEFSKQALTVATKIAETFKASLCIAHCINNDDLESSQEAGLEVLEKAKSNINGLEIETKLLVVDDQYGLNAISMAIAESATEWKADLLVVGTSNRKGLERFFSGSVAEELIKKVDCSIMLVRIS